jgi:hypothetical protein
MVAVQLLGIWHGEAVVVPVGYAVIIGVEVAVTVHLLPIAGSKVGNARALVAVVGDAIAVFVGCGLDLGALAQARSGVRRIRSVWRLRNIRFCRIFLHIGDVRAIE